MTKLEEFARIFQLPPAMIPHIDYVVNERELDLVVGLGDKAMTVDQIAEMMAMSREEAEELVAEALHRAVIKKIPGRGVHARSVEPEEGPITYSAGVFYRRVMDSMAMYENWGDVPAEARDAVIRWRLQEFVEYRRPLVEEIKKDPDAFDRITNQHVLLLEEALEMAEAATVHMVIPCGCRAVVMACNRPVETCLWFDDMTHYVMERGKRISREETKAILVDADRAGLIHMGPRNWRETGGPNSICNCCACCCYPFRAGLELDMIGQWPKAFHIAARDLSQCIHCGLCTERCYFGAFHRDGSTIEVNGKTRKAVQFDPEKCWGCGLCANTCPTEAIAMVPLREIEKEAA